MAVLTIGFDVTGSTTPAARLLPVRLQRRRGGRRRPTMPRWGLAGCVGLVVAAEEQPVTVMAVSRPAAPIAARVLRFMMFS